MSLVFKQYLEDICTMFRKIYYYMVFCNFFSKRKDFCCTPKYVSRTNNGACALTCSVLKTGNKICPNYPVWAKVAQITKLFFFSAGLSCASTRLKMMEKLRGLVRIE